MIVAVMQPYFFPYIGYWQLLAGADTFVIFDDVNYINRGWINRNRILVNGEARYFNIPLKGASQNLLINEIELVGSEKENDKLLKQVEFAYKKAPEFGKVFPAFEACIRNEERNLARFLGNTLEAVSAYLKIGTKLVYSSELEKDPAVRGQQKVLACCKALGATEYRNPIGGTELYDKTLFKENGIDLYFLKADDDIVYRQYGEAFVPFLSMLDVLMFNDVPAVRALLKRYTLL